MGIISVENSDRWFWLGRYLERVQTTLQLFNHYYDMALDTDKPIFNGYLDRIGIQDSCSSREEFMQRYLYDENNSFSIIYSLERALDNGIALRDAISTNALSYIQMAIDVMKHEQHKGKAPAFALMPVIDNLYAFWGCVGDFVDDVDSRHLMLCGKYVERMDLYIRMGYTFEETEVAYLRFRNRLNKIHEKSLYRYNEKRLEELDKFLTLKDEYEECKGLALVCLNRLFTTE